MRITEDHGINMTRRSGVIMLLPLQELLRRHLQTQNKNLRETWMLSVCFAPTTWELGQIKNINHRILMKWPDGLGKIKGLLNKP